MATHFERVHESERLILWPLVPALSRLLPAILGDTCIQKNGTRKEHNAHTHTQENVYKCLHLGDDCKSSEMKVLRPLKSSKQSQTQQKKRKQFLLLKKNRQNVVQTCGRSTCFGISKQQNWLINYKICKKRVLIDLGDMRRKQLRSTAKQFSFCWDSDERISLAHVVRHAHIIYLHPLMLFSLFSPTHTSVKNTKQKIANWESKHPHCNFTTSTAANIKVHSRMKENANTKSGTSILDAMLHLFDEREIQKNWYQVSTHTHTQQLGRQCTES